MDKRSLRLVKQIGAVPCVAVCTYCSKEFKATTAEIRSLKAATESLQAQFDAHKCKPSDSS